MTSNNGHTRLNIFKSKFEGIRLDMEDVDEAFVIEFLDYDMPDIQKILQETCCLVEIGILPFIEESTILKITWL